MPTSNAEASIRRGPLESTRRASVVLLLTFLVGFILMLGIGIGIKRMTDALDARLANERNHLLIGEQIVLFIKDAERLFHQMASAGNRAAYKRIAREIEAVTEHMQKHLDVLERGGTVRQELALNLYGLDQMVREVEYRPAANKTVALEVLEIAPFIPRIIGHTVELEQLLDERDRCVESGLDCTRAARAKVVMFYKELSPFFYRLNENANRLFFESANQLTTLEAELRAHERTLRLSQLAIVSLIAVIVMAAGYLLIRRINLAQSQLDYSRQRAEDANLAKSRFLATMSHEIRTPMNGILGMAQLLESPDLSEVQRRNCVRVLQTSGQTLLTLLNDILDLSRVESGKIELHETPASPLGIARETAALFAESAQHKGLKIEVESTLSPADGYLIDSDRIRQMLSNLVNNAIKFTHAGLVKIEIRETGRDADTAMLEFAVADTGIGIPQEKQALLFQNFSQTDSSTTRRYGGSGLGLSIVRQFATLMDGSVGVDSREGAGARFWFRIRVTRAELAASATAAPALAEDAEQGSGRQLLQPARILVAEDTPANRTILQLMLGKFGMQVHTVEDGRQALDAYRQAGPFDCVLLDMQMPHMDGIEAARAMRDHESAHGLPRCPIVAITANAYADDREACIAAGMDDYLAKPVLAPQLREMLCRWLAASQMNAGTAPQPAVASAATIDRARVSALAAELLPLIAGHMFDAIKRFEELEQAVLGTGAEEELAEIRLQLNRLNFTAAEELLRAWATAHGLSLERRLQPA